MRSPFHHLFLQSSSFLPVGDHKPWPIHTTMGLVLHGSTWILSSAKTSQEQRTFQFWKRQRPKWSQPSYPQGPGHIYHDDILNITMYCTLPKIISITGSFNSNFVPSSLMRTIYVSFTLSFTWIGKWDDGFAWNLESSRSWRGICNFWCRFRAWISMICCGHVAYVTLNRAQ